MCRTYILNIYHRVLFVSLLFYFHVSPLDFRARVEYTPEGPWPIPNIPNTLARLSVFPLRRIFIIHFASAVSTARIMQSAGRFRESKLFLPFSLHLVPYPRLSILVDRRNRVKLVISNIYRISHLTPHPLASSRTVRFRETGAKVPVIQCLTSLLPLLLLHSFLIRPTSYFRTVPPSLETADYTGGAPYVA